jgi:hypothetical protein
VLSFFLCLFIKYCPIPNSHPLQEDSTYATKDPLQGHYHNLFASFDIDINNAQNGVNPSSLHDFIAAAGAQNLPSALGLFSNGVLHPYICPARVDRALGASASPLDGKLYAFNNDLHRNQGSAVEISNHYFNLVPNTVMVSTVPNILTELAADPTLETLGPYVNGDANTEVVHSRYLIPILFNYVNIFLPSGITPRRFFLEVYTLMVTDQIEQDCLSLIRFMQIALTIPGPNLPSSIRVIFIFQIFSQIIGFRPNIWIYRQRPRFLAKYLLSNISKISEMPCNMNI